jgi:hypothetical protein
MSVGRFFKISLRAENPTRLNSVPFGIFFIFHVRLREYKTRVFNVVQQPHLGSDRPIVEVSRPHTHTQPTGLL